MPTDTLVAADLITHAQFNPALNRKAQNGVAFFGYYKSAPLITKLVGPGGTFMKPESYRSSGRVSDDGFEFGSDVKMTEQRGMGSNSVLRRDVQQKDFDVEFAFLETKKLSIEVSRGLDLSAKKMSSDGEFRFSHGSRPPTLYWRGLYIACDGVGDTLYYLAKYFPRMTLTAKSKEVWRDKEEGAPLPVTLGADEDPVLGTACVEYIFGPGALAAASAMGIEVDTVAAA